MRKNPFSSIAVRLSISTIAISLMGIFLIGMSAYHLVKQYVVENVKKEVHTLGWQATQNVSNFFKQRQNDLESISETPLFSDFNNYVEFGLAQEAESYRNEIEEYLRKFSLRSGVYNGLWYLDKNGMEVATIKHADIVTKKGSFPDEPAVQGIVKEVVAGKFAPLITADSKLGATLFYAKPLRNKNGKLSGMIILGASLQPIREILDRLQIGSSGWAGVLDNKKQPVFPTSMPDIEKTNKGNLFSDYSEIPDMPWQIAMVVDLNHFLNPLAHIRLLTTVLIFICGLLVAFSVYRCVRLLIRPVETLVKATQELAAGNLQGRVEVQRNDELGTLSHAFNDMAQTLQTRAHENKKLVENIRRSETRYRTTLDSSLDAIIGLDAFFKITTWNRGAQNMFGYTTSEAIEKDVGFLFPPVVAEDLKKKVTHAGFIQNYDVDGLTKLGAMINLNLTWAGSNEEEKNKEWSLVIRDTTDQKRLFGQLIQAEKLSVVGQLISGIAHEINSPLTAVIGYAELLASSGQKLSREIKEDLQFIYDNSVRCRDIVSNLLRFVRKANLQKKNIDLNEIIRSALKLLHFRVVKKESIQLTCELAPHLPAISGDSQQLEQVIVNLIHNACDALSESKGPKHIIVRTLLNENSVLLQISDSGPGIPAHIQARIFEPFFTTKDEGKGTGLGLAITQRLIHDHGGSIRVESLPNYGTTFLIILPASRAEEKEPSSQMGPDLYPKISGKKILLIDDETDLISLMKQLLTEDENQVDISRNGLEGIKKIKESAFDIVIANPRAASLEKDEIYLAREMCKKKPAIIFVTGNILNSRMDDDIKDPGIFYLCKPFSLSEFRQTTRRAMATASMPPNVNPHVYR